MSDKKQFLLVFEYIDESVFQTIANLRHHLDIGYKGQYSLHVGFNSKQNGFSKLYNLLGAPALIDLKQQQVIYGNFKTKEFLKVLS